MLPIARWVLEREDPHPPREGGRGQIGYFPKLRSAIAMRASDGLITPS